MARLESIAKGGFYAAPVPFINAIRRTFAPTKNGGKGIDGVAGKGEAADALMTPLGLEVYANELELDRAQACVERFGPDRALQGDIFEIDMTPESMVMVYMNPPYTFEMTVPKERREFAMIQNGWKWLQPTGYMVAIVYDRHMTQDMAYMFHRFCDQVDVYKWSEKHLETNTYIAIIGRKAPLLLEREVAEQLGKETFLRCNEGDIPDILDAPEGLYRLPRPRHLKDFWFQHRAPNAEHLLGLMQVHGAQNTSKFSVLMKRRTVDFDGQPPMNLKPGHLVMQISTGALDKASLETENGFALLRATIQYVAEQIDSEERDDGSEVVVESIRPVPKITLLHSNGHLDTMQSDESIKDFLMKFNDQLMELANTRLKPLYDIGIPEELDSQKQKYLPLLRKLRVKGEHVIFPAQQHIVAGTATLLEQYKGALVIAQQGTGKTSMSTALMYLWQATGRVKPGQTFLITCPTHLVKKWAREIKGMLPKSLVTTLILEDERGRHDILAEFADHMRQCEQLPDDMVKVVVISQDTAKLAEGWEPAYFFNRKHGVLCPQTGAVPHKIVDDAPAPLTEEDMRKGTRYYTLGEEKAPVWDADAREYVWTTREVNHNGHALWQEKRSVNLPTKGNGRAVKVKSGNVYSLIPGEPIVDPWLALQGVRAPMNPRGPLWRLVQRYKGRIAMGFFDEIHESQNISTDRGQSMNHLAASCDKVVGLTGTIFNGYADSLYGIEVVFNPGLFRWYEWGNRGLQAWQRDMGVLERTTETKGEDLKNGVWTGTKRTNVRVERAPGASPLLVKMVNPHSVFLSLKDIAAWLPEFTEIPMGVDMTPEMQRTYDRAEGEMKDYLRACKIDGDASFLSRYFRTMVDWPDTAFRPLEVIHHKKIRNQNREVIEVEDIHVTALPSVKDQWLPKELALIEIVEQEINAGRGVGIYCQQTGEGRSYQDRMARMLREYTRAQPTVLHSSVQPIEREEWLEKEVSYGANVLITNPFLVQTGLDLLTFPTLIFFEPEYKLSVLLQAAARAWRLGQTKECKVYYMYYNNSMQEKAMTLIGAKKAAAAVVNGDEVALSAMSSGGGDILKQLMKSADGGDSSGLQIVDLQEQFRRINAKVAEMKEHAGDEWQGIKWEDEPFDWYNDNTREKTIRQIAAQLKQDVPLAQMSLF